MENISQAELLSWCNVVTQDYTGVNIEEEDGGSWRSGLGLCAIIARFRPDLIQFDALGKRMRERSNNFFGHTISDPRDCHHNRQLAFSVSEQYLGISAPNTLEEDDHDMESVLEFLGKLYERFSLESPLPASRRSTVKKDKKEVDIGLGDSLSSSFSSQSSLTSSILFSSFPNHSDKSLVNDAQCRRSYESLLDSSLLSYKEREARRQSESFAAALQKFSSLSNTNISIKLPVVTQNHQKESRSSKIKKTPQIKPVKESEEKYLKSAETQTVSDKVVGVTMSTQTESLEEHGLQPVIPGSAHVHLGDQWSPPRDTRDYYTTLYSGHYQMYSTLV